LNRFSAEFGSSPGQKLSDERQKICAFKGSLYKNNYKAKSL
jgi:hypothetical protein